VNPSTAFAVVLADELARCGLREVVVAPGSRSTPLAIAFWALERAGRVRLHVRIDERSASFTALGLAKASRRPVAVLCTSGTAAANFHPAVIEADESAVPLLVLTADRPPELRGTGASQTIDQVKLYGSAVRWYAEAGVPERRTGMAGYWRSLACRAWANAAGALGARPGPVHLNLPFRDPLVPDDGNLIPSGVTGTLTPDNSNKRASASPAGSRPASAGPVSAAPVSATPASVAPASGSPVSTAPAGATPASAAPASPASAAPADGSPVSAAAASATRSVSAAPGNVAPASATPVGGIPGAGPGGPAADPLALAGADWPEPITGRPDGAPWTRVSAAGPVAGPLELPWSERGVIVCGDGDYDAAALVQLAQRAGWPVLAEPSSGARRGPNALVGYQYLLASPEFMAAHRPEVVISAGRPGLTRPQSALMGLARAGAPAVRHVVIASGPGMWADPQRAATDVALAVRLTGAPGQVPPGWLGAWLRADAAAARAAGAVLDAGPGGQAPARAAGSGAAAPGGRPAPASALSEPEVARELLAALPESALLWCGNSLSVRDLDVLMPPRADTRVIASRGASGIDGTFSTAAGAALAHAAEHPGAVAFALIGDLSLLHDAPGLAIGPAEPRPDLCVVVVNNDGGGIFEGLEPARFKYEAPGGPSVFERVFGTSHGTSLEQLAAAFGLPYALVERAGGLAKAIAPAIAGTGPRIVEVRTGRAASEDLRARMRAAAAAAATLAGG
jgi:2-succinyl-5-enolpyruvyl-6-hydroxy-3-cyclohexene-1-carboxylate synthase